MKKFIIMGAAIITSLLWGEIMMAAVFLFVMLSGTMASRLLSESARQVVECPALVFKPAAEKLKISPSA